MSGTVLAQAVPIAISPLLTRLFSPEDFGVYAVFLSLTSILSISSAGRYELALMLPKKDTHAGYLLISSLLIVFLFSATIVGVIGLFGAAVGGLLGLDQQPGWLYFIPMGVLLSGVNQVLYYWLNRRKNYTSMRNSRVIQTSVTAACMFLSGVFGCGFLGLISGYLLGQFFGTLVLIRRVIQDPDCWEKNRKKQWVMVKRYVNFPLFSGPTQMLNSISSNLLVFVLTALFGSFVVGFYSLSNRVSRLPLKLIASAFSSVFYEKIVNSHHKKSIYLKSFALNVLIGSVVLLPLVFFGEPLFGLVFGSEWRESGKIASILVPLLLASFSVGSVSTIFAALHRNELSLIWQVVQLLIIGAVIWLFRGDFYEMLTVYSYAAAGSYLLMFFMGLWAIDNEKMASAAK